MVLEFKIIYAFNRAIFVLSTSLTVGHPLASVRACSGFCHVHDIQSRKSSDDIGTRVVLKRRRTQATIWSRGQHEEWKKSSFPAEFLHNPTFPVQNFWFSKVFYIFSCFFTRSVVDGLSARANTLTDFIRKMSIRLKSLCAQTFTNKPDSSAKLHVERRRE